MNNDLEVKQCYKKLQSDIFFCTCIVLVFLLFFNLFVYSRFDDLNKKIEKLSNVNTSSVQTQSLSLQPMDNNISYTVFDSSNILLPYSPLNTSTLFPYNGISFGNFRFRMMSTSSGVDLTISLTGNIIYLDNEYVNNTWDDSLGDGYGHSRTISIPFSTPSEINFLSLAGYPLDNSYVLKCPLYVDAGFVSNISRIVIEPCYNMWNKGINGLAVWFYDVNNKTMSIQFSGAYGTLAEAFMYCIPSRTFFVNQSLSDNEIYQAGYDAGYNNGDLAGRDAGYNIGYNSGYQDGELTGYNNGINTANTYSFSNLLTAVVEAPVNVFIKLLDFDIMGYNLLNIVLGLLTLVVVVLVIKLCLGGK